MRRIILLVALMAAAASVAMSQVASAPSSSDQIVLRRPLPLRAAACRGVDLSVRHVNDDTAMGGQNIINYALRNNSSSKCTLKGYPRYELLDKSGKVRPRRHAINSQQLPGDDARMPPQLVTIEPGKEAWFRVYYNSGGAGYVGKPCPVSREVRITAPGTTRTFVLKEGITLCQTVEVSAVRRGPVPE